MLSALAAYLPQDRRRALAEGVDLPDQTAGTALFADISSFTPLTEALDRALGARRGAEELTRQINAVYDALIAEVDRYGGSVIGFAGDAITCWFDESVVSGPSPRGYPVADEHGQRITDNGSRTALRATSCALAMQTAMRQFAVLPLPDGSTTALGLKVALASGAARRFVVGDPSIQMLDVLTGAPLARTAAGEHLAAKGEVLIDAATATALGDQIQIAAWRVDEESGERFTVVSTNHAQPPTTEPVSRTAPHPLTTLSRATPRLAAPGSL
jgi:adenylate cyclase